jgi:guanidinoacetate N-methyltransferase
MTRRIKRHKDFEITLQIKNDEFIRPPRDAQRNWVLNRALKEFSDDLTALDTLTKDFISGTDATWLEKDRGQESLSAQQIMEDWQIPIMQAMAKAVTGNHGDVVEIGFGRGIASDFIQDCGVSSHTIIECNPDVIRQCETWREQHSQAEIDIVTGMWQDVIDTLGEYDGIFFHTYPLGEEDHIEQVVRSTTFAEHFFSTAADHLKPGGKFSYLSNETDSLSRSHQRLLFRYFTSFSLSQVTELNIPENSGDAHWTDAMVIIEAVK